MVEKLVIKSHNADEIVILIIFLTDDYLWIKTISQDRVRGREDKLIVQLHQKNW